MSRLPFPSYASHPSLSLPISVTSNPRLRLDFQLSEYFSHWMKEGRVRQLNAVLWREIPVPCWTLWLFCRVCVKKQSITSGVIRENNAEQCSPNISCILFFYFLFCLDFPSSSFSWDKPWLCSCIEWIMASQHNHCKQHHFENNYHHCDFFWQFFLFSDCNQTLCAAHVCRRDRSLGAKLMRTQLVTNFAFQQFVTQTCCQLVRSSFCIFLHCKTSLNVRMLGYTMILYDIE